jgi:hypothetical protein
MHTRFWSEDLKRAFGRPRRIWKENIRMNLGEKVKIVD